MDCYPSRAFPLPCEKYPPRPKPYTDDKEYKKWDSWYVWRYLLEPAEDYEEIYQVGASEITEWIKRAEMIAKMSSKDRFKYRARIYMGMSSITYTKAKYRFAKRAKNI